MGMGAIARTEQEEHSQREKQWSATRACVRTGSPVGFLMTNGVAPLRSQLTSTSRFLSMYDLKINYRTHSLAKLLVKEGNHELLEDQAHHSLERRISTPCTTWRSTTRECLSIVSGRGVPVHVRLEQHLSRNRTSAGSKSVHRAIDFGFDMSHDTLDFYGKLFTYKTENATCAIHTGGSRIYFHLSIVTIQNTRTRSW